MEAAAQDVALTKRLPFACAEDITACAVTDEVGKELRHVRVEVNDVMSVRSSYA
jgi:hypothetical protein